MLHRDESSVIFDNACLQFPVASALRAMALTDSNEQAAAATLGELIDRNTSAKGISEEDWVQLLRSIADGDTRALYIMFESLHRLVYKLAIRITGNHEVAEEVTIDVYHDIWHRSQAYEPAAGPVIGWIMNLARSRAIGRLSDQRNKERFHANGTAIAASVDPGGQDDGLSLERSERLRRALSLLAPEERS